MLSSNEQFLLEKLCNINLDKYALTLDYIKSGNSDIVRSYLAKKYEFRNNIFTGKYTNIQLCFQKHSLMMYHIITITKRMPGIDSAKFNQIKMLKTLKHECLINIIEVYNCFDDIFIITDATEGNLFDAILEKSIYSERNVSTYIFYIASALRYLHAQQIVHRNLTPANIFIYRRKDGMRLLKVGDLNVACKALVPLFKLCGSPAFMAPEMINGNGYGIQVDLWSLGVIAFLLLSGKVPFKSSTIENEVSMNNSRNIFEENMEYWKSISKPAKELVSGLLTINASERLTALQLLKYEWIKDEEKSSNINICENVFPLLINYMKTTKM